MGSLDIDVGYVVIRQVYNPKHNAAAPVGVAIFDRRSERWGVRFLGDDEDLPCDIEPLRVFFDIVRRQIETYAGGRCVPYAKGEQLPWTPLFWLNLGRVMTCAIQLDVPKALCLGRDFGDGLERLFQSVVEPVSVAGDGGTVY